MRRSETNIHSKSSKENSETMSFAGVSRPNLDTAPQQQQCPISQKQKIKEDGGNSLQQTQDGQKLQPNNIDKSQDRNPLPWDFSTASLASASLEYGGDITLVHCDANTKKFRGASYDNASIKSSNHGSASPMTKGNLNMPGHINPSVSVREGPGSCHHLMTHAHPAAYPFQNHPGGGGGAMGNTFLDYPNQDPPYEFAFAAYRFRQNIDYSSLFDVPSPTSRSDYCHGQNPGPASARVPLESTYNYAGSNATAGYPGMTSSTPFQFSRVRASSPLASVAHHGQTVMNYAGETMMNPSFVNGNNCVVENSKFPPWGYYNDASDMGIMGTSHASSAGMGGENSPYNGSNFKNSLSGPSSRTSSFFTTHSNHHRYDVSLYNSAGPSTMYPPVLSVGEGGGYIMDPQGNGIWGSSSPNLSDPSSFSTMQHLSCELPPSVFNSSQRDESALLMMNNSRCNPSSSLNNMSKNDHFVSSTLLSLGDQQPSPSSKYLHSQSLNSTSGTTTNATNGSSGTTNKLDAEMESLQLNPELAVPNESVNVASASVNQEQPSLKGKGHKKSPGKSSAAKEKHQNSKAGSSRRKNNWREGEDDPIWEAQYAALCDFHKKYGHSSVPARYKTNKKLGLWVMTQRRQHTLAMEGKPSALTKARAKRLAALEFVWNVRPDPVDAWNSKFEELKEFKKKCGHCLVPQRYHPNVPLGTWVHTQRRHYKLLQQGKNSGMTEEKMEKLNSIGFVWVAKKGADDESREESKSEEEKMSETDVEACEDTDGDDQYCSSEDGKCERV